MKVTSELEAKVLVNSWERNSIKGRDSSNTHLLHGCV